MSSRNDTIVLTEEKRFTQDEVQELQMQYKKHAEENRLAWAKNDAERDAGIQEPKNVKKLVDIAYAESKTEDEKRWHMLDIYYPEEELSLVKDGKYPVIVSVHGGGWFYGNKELYRLYTMTLATFGFAVVNFNYRLSPEYKYPSGFCDVCSVMDFVAKHAEQYSFDLERVYMVGDSAGAQLASQYSIFATNPEYRKLFAFSEQIEVVVPKKVALNCGVYDVGKRFQMDELCYWYIPTMIDSKLAVSYFRLLDYMTKDFPPTYLMMSVNDPLGVHTAEIKEKLEALSIPFEYREVGQDEPKDGHVFHLDLRSENGKRVNREEMEFFKNV